MSKKLNSALMLGLVSLAGPEAWANSTGQLTVSIRGATPNTHCSVIMDETLESDTIAVSSNTSSYTRDWTRTNHQRVEINPGGDAKKTWSIDLGGVRTYQKSITASENTERGDVATVHLDGTETRKQRKKISVSTDCEGATVTAELSVGKVVEQAVKHIPYDNNSEMGIATFTVSRDEARNISITKQ